MSSLLSIRSLSHHYDTHLVYENLDLDLKKGEWIALLGESGCGKSTLLRAIAGLSKPSQGHILLDGEDLSTVPPHKRGVGLVFQDYALFPNLSIAENIQFGMSSYNKPTQTEFLLELIGLETLAQRKPAQLSGGQQQRVALARALAAQPKLLLLDEPFANIDAARKEELGLELRHLLKDCSVILVTHDRSDAMALADKLAIFDNRNLAQIDSPEVVYTQPKTLSIAQLTGPCNIIQGIASGKSVQTDWGIFPLIEAREGTVSVLIRPDDIAVENHEDGTLQILHQHYIGGQFRIYAQEKQRRWTLNNNKRLNIQEPIRIVPQKQVWAFPPPHA